MKGFQLFYEAFKSQLQSQLDVIISALHFMLVNEDFVCTGVGDEFTPADDTAGGEELPSGWNSDGKVYALKYRSRTDTLKVIVKGILVGEMFIVSAVPMNSSETVHSVNVNPNKYVTANWRGSYTEAFVSGDVQPLANLLKREVFTKLREPKASEKSKEQEQSKKNDDDPLREGQIATPRGFGPDAQRNPYANPYIDPTGIGRGDLDPFNRGVGGGMLFDPFRPNPAGPDPSGGILPPGAVPPGARFDPFNPGPRPKFPPGGGYGKGSGFPPPDHFPPPGGYDPFM